MVNILTAPERDAIAAAVARAEAATRGEIVTIVTRRSVSYAAPTLAAALALGFAAAVAAHLLYPFLGIWSILAIQAAALGGALVLLDWGRVVPRFIPASLRHAHVRRLARAQFAEAGLHNTPDRAAILLLVSLDERCVELIADSGIDAHATPGHWDGIAATLTAAIRREGLAPALSQAIAACGTMLAAHFPADGVRENRLDDAPVEL